MLFFLGQGFRVIAHDRRGHGRSSQPSEGNEMDTYASDVAELVASLDLRGAIHIGHSTGGGEVAHYVARAQPGRRSEEHTSELQSLMRNSYAVFCLKKKTNHNT